MRQNWFIAAIVLALVAIVSVGSIQALESRGEERLDGTDERVSDAGDEAFYRQVMAAQVLRVEEASTPSRSS